MGECVFIVNLGETLVGGAPTKWDDLPADGRVPENLGMRIIPVCRFHIHICKFYAIKSNKATWMINLLNDGLDLDHLRKEEIKSHY